MSSSGLNDVGFDNKEFDDLLDKAGKEGDAAKRKALLQGAERAFLDSNSLLPIYYYVTTHLVNPKVKGMDGNVMDHIPDRYVTIEE